ncbi:uncharacterized protein LOC129787110 [Lutzomyia longipalpis]|uniref:uncharacterized protein LOC129787110 n=1 Tax=Lutzomyia longipalpis TaxID=7200 RepID=UPI0024845C46|nr:uncharacterized protein LOC129787110 [Lutzomyia longipalpis]
MSQSTSAPISCSICNGTDRVMKNPNSKLRTVLFNNFDEYKGGSVCFACYTVAQKRHREKENRALDDSLDRIVNKATPAVMKLQKRTEKPPEKEKNDSSTSSNRTLADILNDPPAISVSGRQSSSPGNVSDHSQGQLFPSQSTTQPNPSPRTSPIPPSSASSSSSNPTTPTSAISHISDNSRPEATQMPLPSTSSPKDSSAEFRTQTPTLRNTSAAPMPKRPRLRGDADSEQVVRRMVDNIRSATAGVNKISRNNGG